MTTVYVASTAGARRLSRSNPGTVYRPANLRPARYRGRRRARGILTWNPGYVIGAAAGSFLAAVGVLGYTMGVTPW